jgi:hypothetical protein
MLPLARWRGNPWLLAGALIGIFPLALFFESRIKSPVYDEPPHIASGLSYVATGLFRANPQHPPLLKELSAVFMLLGGIRWPRDPLVDQFIRGPAGGQALEWPIGSAILEEYGPDRTLFWARLPFILLAGLAAAVLFTWGRQMFGGLAALGAVFLFVMDPTVLAHSFLVTMDGGLTAFTVVFFFALWNFVRHPTLARLLLCGLAIGALLSTKFSALFLMPVAAALLVAAGPRAAEAVKKPAGRRKRPSHASAGFPSRGALWGLSALAAMCLVAAGVILALYFFSSDPFLYLAGLRKVNADHAAGLRVFMAGRLAPRFLSYFAVAYLLKEPIGSIVLAGFGLAVLLRRKTIPLIDKLFLLLPPAALAIGHTIWADDMGVRYILPAFPFAHLLGGLGLAALARSAAKPARYAAAVLCAWVALAALGVYPDHLAYFNEAACLPRDLGKIGVDGGTRCGPAWLSDSNVDWGQGLKQLRAWIDRNAKDRPIRLAYAGVFPPAGYGIQAEPAAMSDLVRDPRPGLYAVSAQFVGAMPAMPGASQWLRATPPMDIVGHAFYIYDVRPKSPAGAKP